MFEQILSKNAKNVLAAIGETNILDNAYMAGGTALALQIGHRASYDFDFFINKKFDEKAVLQKLMSLSLDFELERKEWQTILAYINKVRFSLFFYDYPLLFPACKFLNIDIADIKDIAPMKIAAISDRGVKRDFIDLYFIVERKKILTLAESFELYNKKFKNLNQNKIHILKSLVYFEDAEEDVMPEMYEKVSWKEVKDFFKKEQKKLLKNLINV